MSSAFTVKDCLTNYVFNFAFKFQLSKSIYPARCIQDTLSTIVARRA